ncbi:hypothetical protein ACGFNU_42105 [Spirillospora sp. NPDC048911]|uniref:hypothetical protein n=1 Tax=Spirillospora sp. NPDC048911 TaxID=3364527 RepID=UPI003722B9EE
MARKSASRVHWNGAKWSRKDNLRHLESDGGSGFWAQSWEDVLLHYVGGKVTARVRSRSRGR